MESALRTALIDWLRSDGELATSLNAVDEEAPSPAPAPSLAIAASAAADWSTKTAQGREVRIAFEMLDRNDDAARTAGLASRIEHRIATLPAVQQNFRLAVTQFLRSRTERRPRNLRAVLLEYRFKLLEI